MEKNDGGPAFPGGELVFDDGDCKSPYNPGMSLRDWLAGQALMGLLTGPEVVDDDDKNVAVLAYQYADAMLAVRLDKIGGYIADYGDLAAEQLAVSDPAMEGLLRRSRVVSTSNETTANEPEK